MPTERKKPDKRTVKKSTVAIIIAIAVVASISVILPVSIIVSQDGEKPVVDVSKNDFIDIGKASQTKFGITSEFSIDYTVLSNDVVGVLCYLSENQIQYDKRKSYLVDTNKPSENSFNISVIMGISFVKKYYCYITASYLAGESGFMPPVEINLYRSDPSKVPIPSALPEAPIIDFVSWKINTLVQAYTIYEGTTGTFYLTDMYLVFHSKYGSVSPGIGFTFYISETHNGSKFTVLMHVETEVLSTFVQLGPGQRQLKWQGNYVDNGTSKVASKAWVLFYRFVSNTLIKTPDQWIDQSFSPVYLKIVTTLYGLESKASSLLFYLYLNPDWVLGKPSQGKVYP